MKWTLMNYTIHLICIVFQVLEDVCKKHGFDPEEHGLKYVYQKVIPNAFNQPRSHLIN